MLSGCVYADFWWCNGGQWRLHGESVCNLSGFSDIPKGAHDVSHVCLGNIPGYSGAARIENSVLAMLSRSDSADSELRMGDA